MRKKPKKQDKEKRGMSASSIPLHLQELQEIVRSLPERHRRAPVWGE